MLARTSPSGGGLHPIEAYPLVLRADGVDTGLYHYNGRDHSLELDPYARTSTTPRLSPSASRPANRTFGTRALLVILTARFPRTFWKYRQHPRAYAVVLMDAAHLSQTFYLVSTELGLGAFVTSPRSTRVTIDEELGLDGFSEGAVAISGCGHRCDGTVLAPARLRARGRALAGRIADPVPTGARGACRAGNGVLRTGCCCHIASHHAHVSSLRRRQSA